VQLKSHVCFPHHHFRAGTCVVSTNQHQLVYARKGKGGVVVDGVPDVDNVRAKIAKLRKKTEVRLGP
jgi:hypothetical protein